MTMLHRRLLRLEAVQGRRSLADLSDTPKPQKKPEGGR